MAKIATISEYKLFIRGLAALRAAFPLVSTSNKTAAATELQLLFRGRAF